MTQPDTKQRLLAAAERIVVRNGVTGISVRKVGDSAGVNPTLVTYHFKSIENLLAELARQNLEQIIGEWNSIRPGMDLDDILSQWLRPMSAPARYTSGGRALVVVDELAAHGQGAPRDLVMTAMDEFVTRLRMSIERHCSHLSASELRARLRFISGAALGPPPRTHGPPTLPDGKALDDPELLIAFARAALAGQPAME